MSVFNPAIFIGEAVPGAISGAPLSADSNGLLASGISNTEASATASATAGTGADTLLTGMTITPAAGTYLTWFSCDLNSATSGVVVSVSIYVGGTQKADSLRKVMPFAGGTLTAGSQRALGATNGVVTVNGSQAIEIRWSASAGAPTAAARTMNILRVL